MELIGLTPLFSHLSPAWLKPGGEFYDHRIFPPYVSRDIVLAVPEPGSTGCT